MTETGPGLRQHGIGDGLAVGDDAVEVENQCADDVVSPARQMRPGSKLSHASKRGRTLSVASCVSRMRYEFAADHSRETPAASMMASMTSRNASGFSRSTKRLAMKAPSISDEPAIRPCSAISGRQRAEALEGHRFAEVEPERTRRLGGEKRAAREAVKQKQRHAQGPGRHHDAGEIANHGAADRQMQERQFESCRASQCRSRHHRDQEHADRKSTAREGSASSVRAPSAAAGIAVTE